MPLIYLIIFIAICYIIYLLRDNRKATIDSKTENSKFDLSLYQKKSFLFDTTSEYHFFKLFNELFGNEYHIFPQVNYSHLIVEKTNDPYINRKYRSHIDRRSADFVVCDKDKCIPILVIDIDGEVHERHENQIKDTEINQILKEIGLPILRLKNAESSNGELVKKRVLELIG